MGDAQVLPPGDTGVDARAQGEGEIYDNPPFLGRGFGPCHYGAALGPRGEGGHVEGAEQRSLMELGLDVLSNMVGVCRVLPVVRERGRWRTGHGVGRREAKLNVVHEHWEWSLTGLVIGVIQAPLGLVAGRRGVCWWRAQAGDELMVGHDAEGRWARLVVAIFVVICLGGVDGAMPPRDVIAPMPGTSESSRHWPLGGVPGTSLSTAASMQIC